MTDTDNFKLLKEFEKGVSLENELNEYGFPQMSYDIYVSLLQSLKERTELDESLVSKIFIEARKLLDDYELKIRMQHPIDAEKYIQYVESKNNTIKVEELYNGLRPRFIKE